MKKQTKIWLLLFLIFLGTISTKTISNAAIANQKAFPNSSFPASGNNYCDDGIAIGVKTHYCCVNYATAAYKYIWGHSYYDDRNNRKAAVNYIGSLSSDARIATADNLKKIFANVTPGAYVRLSNESSIPANYDTEGEGHSFIFLGNTNTGAWVAEANYDNAGNAHVTELSWAEIAKKKTYIRYIIWPTAGKYNDELIGKYAPKGEFKVAVGGQGKIYVGGWAYDQDDMSKQIAVDVYIGAPLGSSGAEGHRITANSKDFSEGSGTYHGFSSWITTSKSGSKVPVYCYAVDLTGKANTYLSGTCLYVDISNGSTGVYAPKGEFKVAVGGEGEVYVGGWAYDEDDMSKNIAVDVYIGAPLGSSDAEGHRIRADSKDFSQGSGTDHGFSKWITTSKRGSHIPVYCYAVDLTLNSNTYLSGTALYVDIANPAVAGFDLNWSLDGKESALDQTFATADVYINGKLLADDCTDYANLFTVGATYAIDDIKAKPGYAYVGHTGELTGTITKGGNSVVLQFETVDVHEHIYTTTMTSPTCTVAGVQKYICECGDNYTESIAALGHDWNKAATVDVKPTCTEEGSQSIHCSKCSVTKDKETLPATGHQNI